MKSANDPKQNSNNTHLSTQPITMKRSSFFTKTDTSSQNHNKYGYRKSRLYHQRLQAPPILKKRLFQLIADHQYTLNTSHIENKNITLTCVKAGGYGDIAHTFLCAEKIKKHLPDRTIEIIIENSNHEEIRNLFPTTYFNTKFLPRDYFAREEALKKINDNAGCLLGIAVPVISPELDQAIYRTLREYGYSSHPDCKDNHLSMGFNVKEEGLNFPIIESRNLHDLQTPWLKNALDIHSIEDATQYQRQQKLYHMYMPVWTMQIISIYTIAAIEEQFDQNIDILLPLKSSLDDLIKWRAIDVNVLQQYNIVKIVRITPNDRESINLREGEGKTIQILSGNLPKVDMEIMEQYSQPLFGCTGDASLSSAFVRGNKLPFYADTGLKGRLITDLNETMSMINDCQNLLEFQKLLGNQSSEIEEIYTRNTPKKISYYQSDPSMILSDDHSLPRRSMNEIAPLLPIYAEKIASLYLNTPLLEEAQRFNTYVVENYDVEPRLIAMVHRGLMLKNYPALVKIEKNLWQQFEKGEITEEGVVEKLNEAIATHCEPMIMETTNSPKL